MVFVRFWFWFWFWFCDGFVPLLLTVDNLLFLAVAVVVLGTGMIMFKLQNVKLNIWWIE